MAVWYRLVVSTSVLYLCDHQADWRLLWLTAQTQHYNRVSYHIQLAQGKDQNSSTVSS